MGTLNIPNTFTTGTTIDAPQMNTSESSYWLVQTPMVRSSLQQAGAMCVRMTF